MNERGKKSKKRDEVKLNSRGNLIWVLSFFISSLSPKKTDEDKRQKGVKRSGTLKLHTTGYHEEGIATTDGNKE